MSGHRPFAKLTKNFTEERWQSVATKCTKHREVSLFHISPSGKERKPKMSVSSVSSYLRKPRSLLPTPPMSTPRTQPVTTPMSLKESSLSFARCLDNPFAFRKLNYSGNIASQSKTCQLQKTHEHPVDPLDVPARLREFRAMDDGWYDGEGEAPPLEGLDWLATKFRERYPDDIPLPYTYPTPKGGIEMEWSIGEHSVILEVDLSTHQGDYLGFDDKSDVENTRTLDLQSADGWTWMIDNIRQLTERPK